jgi:hypothetical protein
VRHLAHTPSENPADMNKKEIIQRLANTRLDTHERETLSQLLHYLHAEGVEHSVTTSSNNNTNNSHKRTSTSEGKKSFTHSSNHKGKNPRGRIKDSSHNKHTSSKNTR